MGTFRFLAVGVFLALAGALSGCTPPVDAIQLSNESLPIDRNTQPFKVEVWNMNPNAGVINIEVRPSQPWIKTDVSLVTSAAPVGSTTDVKSVKVTIDRRTLKKGTYDEEIEFGGRGLVPKVVSIRVIQDRDGNQGGKVNIVDLGQTYEKPYLVGFNFRLQDENGSALIAEPAQFTVSGQEGDTAVSATNGIFLRRAAARQFKAAVIFDYSLSMQSIPAAINSMEDAVKADFLPTLNSDALVALYEYHAGESFPPVQVTGFTADKPLLVNRINHIEEDYVGEFIGGSVAWDALVQASEDFGTGTSSTEDRYILLFSDGKDTSSLKTVNDAAKAASDRGIKVYAIAFGTSPNEVDLQTIVTRTGGAYFPAANVAQLESAFEKITTDLEGQYVLRWATLKRGAAQFLPSFTIGFDGSQATLTASKVFNVQTYGSAEKIELVGKLRVVPSDDEVNTIAFLRADYVPRDIKRLRIFLGSEVPFTTTIVGPGDDGLLGAWTKTETPAEGGVWLEFTSSTALPFATFGPLLRFDFSGVVDNLALPFAEVEVDNSFYANGQSFVVSGYEKALPGE